MIMIKKKSSCFFYLSFNSPSKCTLSEPLPIGGYENVERYINDERCLVADVYYPECLQQIGKDLAFLT